MNQMRARGHVLRVFRELAEDRLGKRFPRRARWRQQVRILARQRGWGFADAFLWTMYGGGRMTRLCEAATRDRLVLSAPP